MIVEIKRSGFVQRLGFDEFERRVRDGEVPADVLVRFEPVTGDDFRPAGELEFYRETADPDRLAFRRNLTRAGLPIVTALMVGIQLRVFVWSEGTGRELWLQEHFANWGPAVFEGSEVWRLFTYSFLHAGFAHILMNVCFLAYAGYHIERALGHRNTLTVYTGSVFGGGLLSLLMSPKRYSLGASGGVLGLIGATIVLGWKHWDQIPERSRKYFGWALCQLDRKVEHCTLAITQFGRTVIHHHQLAEHRITRKLAHRRTMSCQAIEATIYRGNRYGNHFPLKFRYSTFGQHEIVVHVGEGS